MPTELNGAFKNLNTSTLWPTAWQVTLTIHSLVPNNFNTYLEFIYNGFNAKTVITNTSNAKSLNTDVLSGVTGKIKQFTAALNDGSKSLQKWLKAEKNKQ